MYRRTPIVFRIADSFFRHQLPFWCALLLVSGLTMGALYARSKTFHAVAVTQVQGETVASALGQSDANTWTTPAQKSVDKFTDLIKQNQPGGFLDAALKKANLVTPINMDPQADDPRYAALLKSLNAGPESANQFSISLTWDNQEEDKSIVEALQAQYIKEVGIDRSIRNTSSVAFLDNYIGIVKRKMRRSEKALADFKASNGGQLSDAESAYSTQLSSLEAQLTDKQITAGESARKRAFFQSQLARIKPMSVLETTLSDQSPVEREIAGLLAKRDNELAGGKTPQHPDVVALDGRISEMEKQQRANAAAPENKRNTQTKLQENPQYQSYNQQIAEAAIAQEADQQEMQNLRQQIGKYQGLVGRIPAAQQQLVEKTRDYRTQQDLYDTLTKKRQDMELQASLDQVSASSSMVPVGITDALPTTGRTKMIGMLLGSLLLGVLVGVILIVVSEWSDHSLRYEADAERLLGVPVLASLPEAAGLRTKPARPALSGGGSKALPRPLAEG